MTGRAQEELTRAIVHDAVRKYIATRRERINLFVDRHFTLAGSLGTPPPGHRLGSLEGSG